jgi:tetratricopeptide (TPR) repeat protein
MAAAETGGWHGWLWAIRLLECEAEIGLARRDWHKAIESASEVLVQSRRRKRLKYETLGLWTRARALDGLGRRHEAIADLNWALDLARSLSDPAMILRVLAALLLLNGSSSLAAEALATLQLMLAALPNDEARARLEGCEAVRMVRRLAPDDSRALP